MLGRKIVIKARKSPKKESSKRTGSSDRSTAQVSQSLKTTAAAKRPRETDHTDVVLLLEKNKSNKTIPSVLEASLFSENSLTEIQTRIRPRLIPDRFEPAREPIGEVYSPLPDTDLRSPPATPLSRSLEKSGSLPRTNSGVETTPSHRSQSKSDEKPKGDAFDNVLDETLIALLELKAMIKKAAAEKDTVKLEGKLVDYRGCLQRLSELSGRNEEKSEVEKKSKDQMEVPKDALVCLQEGINPDSKLINESEALLKQAEQNLNNALVIEEFLEIGEAFQGRLKTTRDCIKTEKMEVKLEHESSFDPLKE